MANSDREIERKYLLRGLPPAAAKGSSVDIDQGYLPGERIIERIRRTTSGGQARYHRTIKLGAGIERAEFEEEINEHFFATVWPLTRGRRVQKRRYAVRDADRVWEIDEFVDRTLVLAEIELERADEAVSIPGWLAPFIEREVTDEPAYTNYQLAR